MARNFYSSSMNVIFNNLASVDTYIQQFNRIKSSENVDIGLQEPFKTSPENRALCALCLQPPIQAVVVAPKRCVRGQKPRVKQNRPGNPRQIDSSLKRSHFCCAHLHAGDFSCLDSVSPPVSFLLQTLWCLPEINLVLKDVSIPKIAPRA